MQVFRSRARKSHHDHRMNATTNGTRIITTQGHGHSHPVTHVSSHRGHGHQGMTSVVDMDVDSAHGHSRPVIIPATHVSSRHRHRHRHRGATTMVAADVGNTHGHETRVITSRDQRRYYRDEPSTVHGLWNKVLGTLTGNRRRRRHGDREMRKAHERREAVRIARGVQQARGEGRISKLRKFSDRRRRRHREHRQPVVVAADTGGRQGETPWLHHKHRTLPPYHGMHHKILGFFTGGQERRALGEAMAAAAEEERQRERNRRRQELKDMGRRYREGGRR